MFNLIYLRRMEFQFDIENTTNNRNEKSLKSIFIPEMKFPFLFISIIYFLFVNIKNKNHKIESLCRYNRFKMKKSKVCKIPCYLKSNYTFPGSRKGYCRKNILYKLNGSVISFNQDIKLTEYWIWNSSLNSNDKYIKVFYIL